MFTGIVETSARVLGVTPGPKFRRITLASDWPDVRHGESIAVNGCCLTVAEMAPGELGFDVIAETLAETNLGLVKAGDRVHVERAMRIGDRIDGHFVQGHVDGPPLRERIDTEQETRLVIEAPKELAQYLVPKGSICVDGVSLTIAALDGPRFEVALIPTTVQITLLAEREIGWPYNLEADVLSKTIVSWLERRGIAADINEEPCAFAVMTDYRPTIAITMGEPAGIGPEVIVKALADPVLRHRARYIIYGMNELLSYAADLAEFDVFWWRDQYHGRPRSYAHDVVVVDYDQYSMLGSAIRGPSKMGGEASMRFCLDAIEAANRKIVDAVVTAPIAKESWKLAGYHYPGHTELFAEKSGARNYAMMFAGGPLKVVLATVHIPLNGLWGKLNIGAVFHPIELLHEALVNWFDIPKPRIAVCGVNPHAGENGQFGDDEKHLISPAIFMAREQGIDATGPYPGDTVFLAAKNGKFDAVVAMYHDQGLIPVKLLAFDQAVNLTIGLPIVRTSPDHGTAFDIVGRNRANPGSMRAAIEMAINLAVRRHQRQRIEDAREQAGDAHPHSS